MIKTPDSSDLRKEPTPRDAQKNGQSAIAQEHPTLELNQSGGESNEQAARNVNTRAPDLSNDLVAILCDIGDGHRLKPGQNTLVEELIRDGFVEVAHTTGAAPQYVLTGKALQFLGERGLGLNEA